MIEDRSGKYIERHALSGDLRAIEDEYLAGRMALEEFRARVEEVFARFRAVVEDGPGTVDPQTMRAADSPATPEDVCRVQADELRAFRRRVASELADIRASVTGEAEAAPAGEDGLAPVDEDADAFAGEAADDPGAATFDGAGGEAPTGEPKPHVSTPFDAMEPGWSVFAQPPTEAGREDAPHVGPVEPSAWEAPETPPPPAGSDTASADPPPEDAPGTDAQETLDVLDASEEAVPGGQGEASPDASRDDAETASAAAPEDESEPDGRDTEMLLDPGASVDGADADAPDDGAAGDAAAAGHVPTALEGEADTGPASIPEADGDVHDRRDATVPQDDAPEEEPSAPEVADGHLSAGEEAESATASEREQGPVPDAVPDAGAAGDEAEDGAPQVPLAASPGDEPELEPEPEFEFSSELPQDSAEDPAPEPEREPASDAATPPESAEGGAPEAEVPAEEKDFTFEPASGPPSGQAPEPAAEGGAEPDTDAAGEPAPDADAVSGPEAQTPAGEFTFEPAGPEELAPDAGPAGDGGEPSPDTPDSEEPLLLVDLVWELESESADDAEAAADAAEAPRDAVSGMPDVASAPPGEDGAASMDHADAGASGRDISGKPAPSGESLPDDAPTSDEPLAPALAGAPADDGEADEVTAPPLGFDLMAGADTGDWGERTGDDGIPWSVAAPEAVSPDAAEPQEHGRQVEPEPEREAASSEAGWDSATTEGAAPEPDAPRPAPSAKTPRSKTFAQAAPPASGEQADAAGPSAPGGTSASGNRAKRPVAAGTVGSVAAAARRDPTAAPTAKQAERPAATEDGGRDGNAKRNAQPRPSPRPKPGQGRVAVSGSTGWDSSSEDVALQMFVPDDLKGFASGKEEDEDALFGDGKRSKKEVEERKRLAERSRNMITDRKSPAGAAFISLFLAGGGMLYTDNPGPGVLFSLLHVGLVVLYIAERNPLVLAAMGLLCLVGAVIGYRLAKTSNALERSRRRAQEVPAFDKKKETHFTHKDLRM